MNNTPPIPCGMPFIPAPADWTDQNVTIAIVNAPGKVFHALSAQLSCASKFFNDRRLTEDGTLQTTYILAFEYWEIVNLFMIFIANGQLPDLLSERYIPKAFDFALRYDSNALHNALVDFLFSSVQPGKEKMSFDMVRDIYRCTPADSALRKLAVDVAVNIGCAQFVQRNPSLPSEFMSDCLLFAARHGVVPFKRGRRVAQEAWLRVKRDLICSQYHRHDQDVDMGLPSSGSGGVV
ncbi:hypothetical protein GQ44DRAFT_824173 [Phaeosphaeriaceae sp. PMI808]|nr:hypothetical protein GQ44DRAFT_824173 [Phaeosphaeriaceae sp. PMI808]